MLDAQTKKRIDDCRDILVGKITDPKSQVEQITIALVFKFMDDMDKQSEEWGGKRDFFTGDYLKYSWGNILSPRIDAHEMLNLYAEGIEKMSENPNLKPLLRNMLADAYLPYRDPETLKLFLKTIDGFSYENSERLGDAYEYLLSVLGSQGDAGQFRTPRHIIDFIVEIIQPKKNDKILDPACGTAGFLISAYKHILNKNTDKRFGDKLSSSEKVTLLNNIYGYDISPDMVRLSLVNLFLHGFTEDDLNIREYDSLTSEDRWNEYFDVVLANPPFMTPKGGIRPHNRFSIKSNRAEVLFVNYIMEHLTPKGKAGIVVPEGIIFQSGTAYKQLRKSLIEKYLIGVVSLPSGVFNPYSGVKTSILILDRQLSQKTDKIFFGKVENDGYSLGAQRREIDKNDLPKIKDGVLEYVQNLTEGIDEEHPNLSYVSKEEILNSSDIGLNYERYNLVELQSNFELKKIKDLSISIQDGDWIEKKDQSEFGIRLLQTGNIGLGNYLDKKDKSRFISQETFERLKCKKLSVNDVLVSRLPEPVGRSCFCPKLDTEIITSVDVSIIKFNKKLINPNYFIFLSNSKSYFKNIKKYTTGSSRERISRKNLMEIEIPLPPLEIQKEIVEELEQYQKVIDGAKQVVDNYKPHIDIDESWEREELSSICDVRDGTHDSPKYISSGYPLITSKNIRDNKIDFENVNYISQEDFEKINQRSKVDVGDIIMPMIGTIGRPLLVEVDNEFAIKNVALIKPKKDNVLIDFVLFILSSKIFTKYIEMNKSGSTQKFISLKNLRSFKLPLPSFEIQNQIVKQLEEERQIVKGNKKLIKIYTQKIEDRINKIWGE